MKNLILFDADSEDFVREALGLEPLKLEEKPKWGYVKRDGEIKEVEGLVDLIKYDLVSKD